MLIYILGGGIQYRTMFNNLGFTVVDSIYAAQVLCFTGGADVSPSLYGEDKHPRTSVNAIRDEEEVAIYKFALNRRIPMVGICRGAQFLHIMNGGSLYQDVDNHAIYGTHEAIDILTQEVVDVTSTHHQMMRNAGSGEVGRGGTVQLFHGSEVAMWRNTDDIETGLMESIPEMDGTEIILESTAKGLGNYFHRMTMDALKGINGYRVAFLPWFWMDEYEEDIDSDFVPTEEEREYADTFLGEYDDYTQKRKLAWRRTKINRYGSDWKFKQEYPSTVSEAFQTSGETLVRSHDVVKARNRKPELENHAPLVIGVDPARNKDRAAIVFRRGREIEEYHTYESTEDDIWFADKIASFILKYKPIIVNIDCTNSWAIHDYLRRKGFDNIRGYHFGESATDNRTYANKRAEMWCLLRDWMQEDVSIPDDDELHADLVSVPEYDETDGKIRLMRKEKIKKEMGFSPDIGDACALTFATKISGKNQTVQRKSQGLKTVKRFERKTTNLRGRR